MLPLFPDSLALGAAIGPFDFLGLCLTQCPPSLAPLSLRVEVTRLLGVSRRFWYQIVGYLGDLVIYSSAGHLFSPLEWNKGS